MSARLMTSRSWCLAQSEPESAAAVDDSVCLRAAVCYRLPFVYLAATPCHTFDRKMVGSFDLKPLALLQGRRLLESLRRPAADHSESWTRRADSCC